MASQQKHARGFLGAMPRRRAFCVLLAIGWLCQVFSSCVGGARAAEPAPRLVLVSASFCPFCKREAATLRREAIAASVIEVDAASGKEAELAKSLLDPASDTIPQLVLIRPGKPLRRLIGEHDAKEIRAFIAEGGR